MRCCDDQLNPPNEFLINMMPHNAITRREASTFPPTSFDGDDIGPDPGQFHT